MNKLIGLFGVATMVAGAAFVTHDVGAAEPPEWSLTNCKGGKLQSGVSCDLKNNKNDKCLIPTKKTGQADWDFGACGGAKAALVSTSGGAIKYGDTVALKLGNEFYRKCVNPQLVGINICSESPSKPAAMHLTWKLTGGTNGEVVAQDMAVSLFNTERGDAVVFARRPSKVVDTCWASKAKLGHCTTARDE